MLMVSLLIAAWPDPCMPLRLPGDTRQYTEPQAQGSSCSKVNQAPWLCNRGLLQFVAASHICSSSLSSSRHVIAVHFGMHQLNSNGAC